MRLSWFARSCVLLHEDNYRSCIFKLVVTNDASNTLHDFPNGHICCPSHVLEIDLLCQVAGPYLVIHELLLGSVAAMKDLAV
jgi:hypothetical protein